MTRQTTFTEGKRPRNELELPQLYFIATDDWLDKLGHRAFTSWLRFITWCNRRDKEREYDKIPDSLENIAKRLGISKPTLYKTIIQPLWEYGFIDLIEYTDSKRKAQKPINIVVYRYPQNKKDLETKPLEKCRDWKDYGSNAQTFAKLRGKKKEEKSSQQRLSPIKPIKARKQRHDYRKNNLTVEKYRKNNLTVYRKKNLTVTVKKILRNNSFKYSINNLNTTNNNKVLVNKESREKILQICNKYYTEFALNRWSKKQWLTMVNKFVDEMIDKHKGEYFTEHRLDRYVYGALTNMSRHHDLNLNELYPEIDVNEDEAVKDQLYPEGKPYYNWLE